MLRRGFGGKPMILKIEAGQVKLNNFQISYTAFLPVTNLITKIAKATTRRRCIRLPEKPVISPNNQSTNKIMIIVSSILIFSKTSKSLCSTAFHNWIAYSIIMPNN